MSNYNTKLSTICLIEQHTLRSLQWYDPKSFITSGDGDANRNTIVSTVLAGISNSDDDFVGNFVMGVDCENIKNNGIVRRILNYDDATGTITCDRFPAQTKTGDTFYLISSPLPFVAEDTGGSTVQIQDAGLLGSDDFWNGSVRVGGPYVEAVKADNHAGGTLTLISDFADTGGIVTANLGYTTVIGDLYEIWTHPEVMGNSSIECTQEAIIRENFNSSYESGNPAVGNKQASGTLEFALRGPGRLQDGQGAEVHRYLKSVLDPYDDAGNLTVNGTGSTSSIPYDSGTAVIGRMYVTAEGDAFMCSSAGTPAIPEPNLTSVPEDNTTVTGLMTYHPSLDANYHLAAKQYRGNGIIEYIFGMLPSVQIAGELGGWCRIILEMMGSDWIRIHEKDTGNISRLWEAKRPSVAPLRLSNMVCKLDNTSYGLKSFDFNMNIERTKIVNLTAPNECDGYAITGYNPTGQVVMYVDTTNKSLSDDQLAGMEKEFLVQAGSTPGYPGVLAIWAKSIGITNYTYQDDNGLTTHTIDFKVNWHSTANLPAMAIGIG